MIISNAIYKIESDIIQISDHKEILVTSTRQSVLCRYYDKLYLISCSHKLNIDSNDFIIINKEKILLDKENKILIPEIDLLIYKITDNNKFKHACSINMNSMKYTINDINKNTKLFVIDSRKQIQIINILSMENNKYNNYCYPDMLKYIGRSRSILNVTGCSGSPIYDINNNIVGILSGINSKYIFITPFFFVKRILDELENSNSFNGFCSFYHDTKIIKRQLIITKNENINYNLYSKFDKMNKLNKDDIILKFDNKFVVCGLIHCDLLNIDIDINAYITITKTINDANIIDICRPRNKVNKNITITTGNRDYYSSVNINLKDNILQSFESKDKIYMKINAYLFEYLCKYRPVFEDNKLLNIFKLKYSEVTENNYLLVQDNILNINLFNKKLDTYIITKETRKL